LLFAVEAALFRAEKFHCGKPCASMQPADKQGVGFERTGFARQIDEDSLCDVAGLVFVSNLPQRRGIYGVGITPHDFIESGFGAIVRKIAKQFSVSSVLHVTI